MQIGLVTYLWGKDWDLPTLIANCEKSDMKGVELRTQHAHGVEIELNSNQRKEVKKRFEGSPVVCVGYGSNYQYDNPDPEVVKKSIEDTKKYILLCHDIGASGIKVKPNQFHEGVPHEKTLEQIGKSLNVLGKFGSDYGQEIRLEVHGPGTSELPNIKAIMDVADHPNVGVCWNCNDVDLNGEGLEYNFNLVKDRFGSTVHVRELNDANYPYQELFNMLVKMDYAGWILLECRTDPADKVSAMIEQDKIFKKMIKNAQ
jgi:sugar phosphate isomerase/epimerase